MALCECGVCGLEVKEGNRFIYMHHTKGRKLASRSEATKLKQSMSKRGDKNPNFGKPQPEEIRKKNSEAHKGEKNHFYGKKHTEKTIKLLSEMHKRENLSEETINRMSQAAIGRKDSEETRKKKSIASSGKNNPMYGRTGELAPWYNRKHTNEERKKISDANLGRQPSLKVGFGISGWLGEFHFRSTCELKYLMDCNRLNRLESAERIEFKVKYETNGKIHYYFPDFVDVELKKIIEIKPVGWRNYKDEKVKVIEDKLLALDSYCKENGFTFELVEVPWIKKTSVFRMRNENVVTLNPKWEKQYQNWLIKQG